MLERSFEVFESAIGEVGRSVSTEKRDGIERHPEARA
jgi:hypothetical protein